MIGWALLPTSQWVTRTLATFLLLLLFVSWPEGVASSSSSSKWRLSRVDGVAGTTVHLPCMAARTHLGDSPILVLWYKDGARLPFYSLDLREGFESEEIMGAAMRGRIESGLRGSRLTLKPALGDDSGQYKCRVDFQNSPTVSAMVTLTVYVVPSRLVILDADWNQVPGSLRSLTEGETLTLYCQASGGTPLPQVTWWRGTYLISNHSRVVGEGGTLLASQEEIDDQFIGVSMAIGMGVRFVRSMLNITLTREYAQANISCKASNNNITEPLSTSVFLEVYTQPSSVVIKGPRHLLVEGRHANLACFASGAHPSAVITWTKRRIDEKSSTPLNATSMNSDGVTSSEVKLVPYAEDHGATISCHAHNPNISIRGVVTTTVLQVTFAPRVSLRLGYSLDTVPVKEGEDVYFECDVTANPPPPTIVWYKDGEVVVHGMKKFGILVSGNNLVLQTVRRQSAGNYSCVATNTFATSVSNTVQLLIRYLPVCEDEPQTVAVSEGEDVRLTCRVDANPEDDLYFTWYFNNTLDTVEVERHRVQVEPGQSFLDYTPRSSRDYGLLACWASNSVGTQATPCLFTVTQAGPPESVTDCEMLNHTGGTLEVSCTPGDDGGLPQWFVSRVYDAPTHTLLATLEETFPRFQVSGLTRGQDYVITITAVNSKGTSDPEEIDAVRLKAAEKIMEKVPEPPVSPLVGVFLGLVGGFVFLLLIGVSLTIIRSYRCKCLQKQRNESVVVVGGSVDTTTTKTDSSTPSRAHASHADQVEAGPDIVKSANTVYRVMPPTTSSSYVSSAVSHYYTVDTGDVLPSSNTFSSV